MTAAAQPFGPGGFGPAREIRRFTARASLTLFAALLLSAYLMPLLYMASTSLKTTAQITEPNGPLYPASPVTYEFEEQPYPIYLVPLESGVRELALVKKGREQSSFVDPADPAAGLIAWQGRWRTLDPKYRFDPAFANYGKAWTAIDFGRLLRNTSLIAILSTIGAVASSVAVAYGFSRFRIPGKSIMFVVLISTIILPFQITLIPQYVAFTTIGWTGTWLPLIVPHFFANAYNVFLLRQYFLTIPRDLDEAAMIDGASPFRVLISIIVPQAMPAIIAVTLFHFFFAWNDFFTPLIYLSGRQDIQPISVGIQQFNAIYSQQPNLIQAAALMALAVPVVVFFLAQRAFMRGVVVTGVEK